MTQLTNPFPGPPESGKVAFPRAGQCVSMRHTRRADRLMGAYIVSFANRYDERLAEHFGTARRHLKFCLIHHHERPDLFADVNSELGLSDELLFVGVALYRTASDMTDVVIPREAGGHRARAMMLHHLKEKQAKMDEAANMVAAYLAEISGGDAERIRTTVIRLNEEYSRL